MVWAVLNPDVSSALEELVKSQSQRAIAVVGGAMLEETLLRSLEYRLHPDPDINKRLFRPDGPLGAFGTKINLGFVLYMYDEQVREALMGMCKIRNLFAHELKMSFDSTEKPMTKALARLTLHTVYTKYPSPLWGGDTEYDVEVPQSNQDKFVVNLKLLLCLTMRDLIAHRPYRNDAEALPGPPVSR